MTERASESSDEASDKVSRVGFARAKGGDKEKKLAPFSAPFDGLAASQVPRMVV